MKRDFWGSGEEIGNEFENEFLKEIAKESLNAVWKNGVSLNRLRGKLKKKTYKISQISLLQVVIITGLIFLIPIYLIEMSMGNYIKLEKPFYLTLTYVVIFPGLASFFFWIKGISIIGANRAGIFLHLMPIFGAIMAMVIRTMWMVMRSLRQREVVKILSMRFSVR